MRLLAVALLLAAGPMLAQDRDADIAKLRERADRLEAQAVEALEAGRKGQALELLTKAADLREEARVRGIKTRSERAESVRRAAAEAKLRREKAEAKAAAAREAMKRSNAKAKKKRAELERLRAKANRTGAAPLDAMDAALRKGDLKAAAEAGRAAHRELAQWQKRLAKREQALRRRAPRRGVDVEERVAALEKQVAELRRLLDAGR